MLAFFIDRVSVLSVIEVGTERIVIDIADPMVACEHITKYELYLYLSAANLEGEGPQIKERVRMVLSDVCSDTSGQEKVF